MLRAFISYPYRPETETFANDVRAFLKAHEVESVDGKWPNAAVPLRDDIVSKIRNCDILIAITFVGIPSPWGDQEIGIAILAGLHVIQITDGEVPRGAEHFHISRAKGAFHLLTALAHTLNEIKQKRYATSSSLLSANAPLDEYESENWPTEVLTLIDRLRTSFAQSLFKQNRDEAKVAFDKYPECWRFLVAQSAALIHLNNLDEADKLLDEVIESFPTDTRALSYTYETKAWVLSRRPGGASKRNLKKRLRCLRFALEHEKRVEPYIAAIECLLQLDDIDDAEREFADCLAKFPKSLGAFRTRVTLQGKEFVKAVLKSHLMSALLFPGQEVMVQ